MIFQEPTTSLNPLLIIELQITGPLTIHHERGNGRARAIELLRLVGIPDAEGRLDLFQVALTWTGILRALDRKK